MMPIANKQFFSDQSTVGESCVKQSDTSKRNDKQITTDCMEALKANFAATGDKIKVVVRSGWVTLNGEVERQHQRAAAETAVRYLLGVTGVTDNITINRNGI